MKSKVDELDVDKLLLVPSDLSILSDVVRKCTYNAKVKNIEDKIILIFHLTTSKMIRDYYL